MEVEIGIYFPYQVFVKWRIGVINQIQNTKPTKMFPIAQNGVIRGDDKYPVTCDQSTVRGIISSPELKQLKD